MTLAKLLEQIQNVAKLRRGWGWRATVAVLFLVLLVIIFAFPRLLALYQLYWGSSSIERLLHDELGFSRAWSAFAGVVAAFFYALIWVPLTIWTYRLLIWRFNGRQLAIAFTCWVIAYGHAPLLHAMFGTSACFNQRTGEPMKWFVLGPDGKIILFDSDGFDTVTRAVKRPVTPEVCAAAANQAANVRPQRITGDVLALDFFDPVTGRPRVWFHRIKNGSYELFDSNGFHPVSSEPLVPVNKSVVAEIVAQAERAAAERAQLKKERAERERKEREQAERERTQRERAERERAERERVEHERREREQAERERIRRERAEREQAERERVERERAAHEARRRALIELVRRDPCKAVSVCPAGKIFSLTHGDCILVQYYGGVIPGSQDDQRYIPGRGWVPNC